MLFLLVCISCTKSTPIGPCEAPLEVSAPSGCYNALQGLPLTASGYAQVTGWEWKVYAVTDTTSTNLTNVTLRMPSSGAIFIVSDSILQRFPLIHVQVATYCNDQPRESMYYSFVRRESAACTAWVRKTM